MKAYLFCFSECKCQVAVCIIHLLVYLVYSCANWSESSILKSSRIWWPQQHPLLLLKAGAGKAGAVVHKQRPAADHYRPDILVGAGRTGAMLCLTQPLLVWDSYHQAPGLQGPGLWPSDIDLDQEMLLSCFLCSKITSSPLHAARFISHHRVYFLAYWSLTKTDNSFQTTRETASSKKLNKT